VKKLSERHDSLRFVGRLLMRVELTAAAEDKGASARDFIRARSSGLFFRNSSTGRAPLA